MSSLGHPHLDLSQGVNRDELLAACLFHAQRLTELERLPPHNACVRYWQGLGYAHQGRLEEARTALCDVLSQRPEFEPARKALAGLLRQIAFYHARGADWEAAASALAESQRMADGWLFPDSAPVVEALIFLLAGWRQEAIQALSEAQRREPTNGTIAHALGLACYHTAQALAEQRHLQDTTQTWEHTIAAWVMLMHHEPFWEEWQTGIQTRYQADLSDQALDEARKQVRERLETLLSAGLGREAGTGNQVNQLLEYERLVQRELKAADLLSTLEGFLLPGTDNERLVCGPLMIRFLGLERAFGAFVSQLSVRRERPDDPVLSLLWRLLGRTGEAGVDERLPGPAQQKQLRYYFSQLGIAQALVELERPQEALAALTEAACPSCQAAVLRSRPARSTPEWFPLVCVETCPGFDSLNPGYAGTQSKGRDLWTDALELAIEVLLRLAQSCITASPMDMQAAADHWQEASRLSRELGAPEPTQRRIVETTLGRVQVLEQRRRFNEAIALLEAAEAVCDDQAAQDLVGRLAEVLADRAIMAGNATLPRWNDAVTDLRRAVRYNPHSTRPLINLGIALQMWAQERYEQGEYEAAEELVQEAVQQLREGVARMPGHPQLEEQYQTAQGNLRDLIRMRAFHLAEDGQIARAVAVLEQGIEELPGDTQMAEDLANARLAMAMLRGRRQ